MKQVDKYVLVPHDQWLKKREQKGGRDIPEEEHISDENIPSTPPSVPEENAETPSQPAEDQEIDAWLLCHPLPKRMQKKAAVLLDRIHSSRDIGWNHIGEFTHDGMTVTGSHMTDLLKSYLGKYKQDAPRGLSEFREALAKHLPDTPQVETQPPPPPPVRPSELQEPSSPPELAEPYRQIGKGESMKTLLSLY